MRDTSDPQPEGPQTYSEHPAMFAAQPLPFMALLTVFAAGATVLFLGVLPALIGLIPVAISGLALFAWYLGTLSVRLSVTEHSVISQRGLLSRNITEVQLGSIRSVAVHQSIFNRLLNVGTIEISTVGDDPEIAVRGLPDPDRIKSLLRR
tara:strand:- start:5385 stop:5834 length:450 start_codon:yes stop_codon:yes gene_type:complete